jgi:hypothetical protein
LAWLGASAGNSKHSRLEQIQGNVLKERDEDGSAIACPAEVHLPEVPKAFANLLDFFFASGQAMQSGMGLHGLTWQEIRAFREENELDMTLYEREILKKMSDAYCSEYVKASDPKRPAPYTPEVEENEVDQIALGLQFIEQLKLLRQKKD